MNARNAVLSHIDLLASPSKQLAYEAKVPAANVHGEMVSGFCSDLYHPKSQQVLDAFSEEELKDLARLYGLLMEAGQLRVSSVGELLKENSWRRVIQFAKDLHASLSARG